MPQRKTVVDWRKWPAMGSVFGERRNPEDARKELPNYLREMPHSLILLSSVL